MKLIPENITTSCIPALQKYVICEWNLEQGGSPQAVQDAL
jgi:hypothetical protein